MFKDEYFWLPCSPISPHVQGSAGCPKKMSHSWEPKKLGTSYSETTHLFGLKLWLQGVLMRAPCCRNFKSSRCLVSEYEGPNFWVPKSRDTRRMYLGYLILIFMYVATKTNHILMFCLVPLSRRRLCKKI